MDNYNSLQEEKEPDDLVRESIIRRNKKKISQSAESPGKSMLKKSDLSLVFLGAGIITLIIFFIFLRPSGDGDMEGEALDPAKPTIAETVKVLEQKMTTLEEMLQAINASQAANIEQKSGEQPDIKPYVARIERVETALSVKFDVLTARVDKMDDKLSNIIRDVDKSRKVVNNMKNTQPAQKPESAPVKSTVNSKMKNKSDSEVKPVAVNKAATNKKSEASASPKAVAAPQSKQQKAVNGGGGSAYHTVTKGDTLYNISKKYNTTVDKLRAMNKMTTQDSIIIGQRIVVKK